MLDSIPLICHVHCRSDPVGSMAHAMVVVMPYVDPSGELKVFASNAEGGWQSNVKFVPGRMSQERDGPGIECRMLSWKTRHTPRIERLLVLTLNPIHLQMAKMITKEKLKGLTVTVTNAGVTLTDQTAFNREKIETAGIWLSLAGQYLALKTQFDLNLLFENSSGDHPPTESCA